MPKKRKKFDIHDMTPEETLRFEIAQEIGCADKIVRGGWGALTAQESGRIGGLISQRNRTRARSEADPDSD